MNSFMCCEAGEGILGRESRQQAQRCQQERRGLLRERSGQLDEDRTGDDGAPCCLVPSFPKPTGAYLRFST